MPGPSPEFDEQMMCRAIRLAMNGRGRVEPNPMVGCVIVKDGRVIGEGYHQQFGGPHAEPNALAACTESPERATAYVTLEPCCHTNKKTPPCVPALIAAKVARVVTGTLDPNPEVNGQGLAQLRAIGINVSGPVLESEAKQLIAPFLARVRHRRPYVTLKWAETADGKVAGGGRVGLVHGKRLQISNDRSIRLVHELRSRSDAILVGAQTIVIDDPKLTARGVERLRPLLRVGLGSRRGVFVNGNLERSLGEGPVLIYCTHTTLDQERKHLWKVEKIGVGIVPVGATDEGFVSLQGVLSDLHARDVTHLLVEPGPVVAESFFREQLADRMWVFRAPRRLDDPSARSAAAMPAMRSTGTLDLAGDTLTEYLNPASPVFFAAEPSADFVLAREAHHATHDDGGGGRETLSTRPRPS
jgi:diaminohydroxyphosphoribosylaminopyrimidine deaminase / 5-amino-6-(5-phosphoribosylamino)uracil reductase